MKNKHKVIIIIPVIILSIISLLLYLFLVKGMTIKENPQYNYAKFLINNNDKMIELMFYFEENSPKEKEYTEEDKEALSNKIIEQNDLVKYLQENPPDKKNQDYLEIYNDLLKSYAFFIQGEIMEMEKIYGETDRMEKMILGQNLQNMMGNVIIELNDKINAIRGTNIKYKYGYDENIPVEKIPIEESIDLKQKDK